LAVLAVFRPLHLPEQTLREERAGVDCDRPQGGFMIAREPAAPFQTDDIDPRLPPTVALEDRTKFFGHAQQRQPVRSFDLVEPGRKGPGR
jgi:hypothetical protein